MRLSSNTKPNFSNKIKYVCLRGREREGETKTPLCRKLITLQLPELRYKSHVPLIVGLLVYEFQIMKGIPMWQN